MKTEGELRELYGHLTDKFSLGYWPVYVELLRNVPKIPLAPAILEIGVHKGGSLKMWKDMYPSGVIVGVDKDVPENVAELPPVIKSDQADPELPDSACFFAGFWDLIIDDASHMGSLSAKTFELLWPLVAPGGWYVLEDWAVGLEGNPHYPFFEGDSMVGVAQSFIPLIRPATDLRDMGGFTIAAGEAGDVDEVRYRYGLAMVHKNKKERG